ncbi:Bug family tripartite tricarboxylate transporter substrate binding protein [Roseivivax sediminis]|uniref:Tat (Twin-arginine translocation) pathway signal sequence n=1 Tax=Roseivivax sediminis TaxID=936889 RepID=A0A1I1V6W4_9RHOB|nr:tripartite tricarboxylate transporter substrate-binding protein [Roseivivax sediminis]SFD78762.1 Tat (twin-arginine translocation) pathway signal sequence [Roseivivax sediminis]
MTKHAKSITRRSFLNSSAAVAGAGALGLGTASPAFAQEFPSRDFSVVIPTGEGGGVDRAARAFTRVWSDIIGANFEFGYYPGASGQVGYELYLNRRDADVYNLLFGNIAPEMIMYATQNPDFQYPEDFLYLAGIDVDDSVIWVAQNSKFETIQDLIEEGQSRTITLSTSRLPHPSTIGALLLAEETGMDVRMIPYGGGSAARSAAVTGEVDGCATFMSSSLSLSDQIRFLGVFTGRNRVPGMTNEAPPLNEALGLDMPALQGQRTWALQRAAYEEYPERVDTLLTTLQEVFDAPEYKDAVKQAGTPWEFIEYTDAEACQESAQTIIDLARRYQDVLSG